MQVRNVALTALAALCLGTFGAAEAAPAASWAPRVAQWGMEELVLPSSTAHANPFTEVQLAAEFRCGGKRVEVQGFYDGDGVWKARFMPGQAGACTFKTTSNDPALNGVSGGFHVGPPAPGAHGPVRVAKTWHFAYADGTPYFLLGTTSYNWLNRDPDLQDETLASLRQSGFTKIRFGLFPKWYKFNRVEPDVFPYVRKADGSFDFDRFDPRFFANLERRLRELDAMGVEADIILFHPYDHWGFAKMDEAHNVAWLRYLTARLAAYRNVWWTMANEYELMGPRDWNKLGETVRAGDPYGHPLGIHNIAVWYDPRQPWLDHVIIQDGSPTTGRSAAIARKRYGKPVVIDEYGYEGNNAEGWGELSGHEELARHWDITMAGGYASHGETYVHPSGVLFWAAGGKLVGEAPPRLAFLKTVMTSLPFQDMAPAPELVSGGTALALPGKAYLFRFTWPENAFAIQRSQVRLAGADLFKVELVDPWQMTVQPLGYTSAGDQAFTMPVAPALLRITAVDKAAGQARPIGDLLAAFAGDLPTTGPAKPELFSSAPMHYGLDFQIAQMQQSPAANAALAAYLPPRFLKTPFFFMTPVQAAKMAGLPQEKLDALGAELAKIPVE
jgi:hypothetical protein